MIKICHVTSVHPKEDVRIFHKECVSLAKAGYDVFLVQQGEDGERDGVHLVGFGQIPESRIKRMLFGAKAAYRAAKKVDADVYHLHDPELLPYGKKLKKLGKKVIFDSHEHVTESILEKQWIPMVLRKVICKVYGGFQTRVCRKLDAIVTVTPDLVREFLQINPRTVQVANYPIFQETIIEPTFADGYVGFAGGISEQWNHHRIVLALEQLPQCRYRLCGAVQDSYLQQLQAKPGWNQVDFLGKIPHQQVAQELAKCSAGLALLTPGRNTDGQNGTIGNTKIFEEMMASLPVICTDFVLWKEFVERYDCGICVDPQNVEQITAAIRELLEHPEKAKRMGENGRRAVKEEFNWAVEEQKLLALYEDILKN